MLLWPAVQRLRKSTLLWQFGNQAFVAPWMQLLGLAWRTFDGPLISAQKHDRIIMRFKTLYLPLWIGLDDDKSYSHLLAYAPAPDLRQVQQTALRAIEMSTTRRLFSVLPAAVRYAVLGERAHLESSRRFSDDDAASIRHLMVSSFGGFSSLHVVSFSQSGSGT